MVDFDGIFSAVFPAKKTNGGQTDETAIPIFTTTLCSAPHASAR